MNNGFSTTRRIAPLFTLAWQTRPVQILVVWLFLGCVQPLFRVANDRRKCDLKRSGEINEGSECRALLTPLDVTNVGDVVAEHIGEVLLAQAAARSQICHFCADRVLKVADCALLYGSNGFWHPFMLSYTAILDIRTIVPV